MTPLPPSTERLGLTSVLTGSLPLTLLTDAAPDRYVVEVVFTRRVEPEEAALILGSTTQGFLATRGYPDVQLTVSDRRLVIANTNLEELRGGLAGEIGELLASIGEQVRTLHHEQDLRRQDEASRLQERSRAITDLASSISFEPSGEHHRSRTSEGDRPATERWDSEGGAGGS